MKQSRKLLIVLLTFVMAITFAPTAFARLRSGLWVGGTEVTSENAANITNAATPTASYDANSKTLTLNGYSYTGNGHEWGNDGDTFHGGIYSDDDLTIEIKGTNSVKNTATSGSYGIYATGKLIFTGSGTMTAEGGKSGIYANNDITINDVNVTAKSEDGYAIVAENGNVTINSGEVIANGGSAGIKADSSVTIYKGTVDATSNSSGIYAQNVALKGGTVKTTGSMGIYTTSYFTIEGGTTEITGTGEYGIFNSQSVNIKGGELTVTGTQRAISGTVANEISGTGWTNTAGTGDKAAIAVNTTGQALTYKKVQFPEVKNEITASAENVTATYDGKAHGITVTVTDPSSGATIKYGKTAGIYDLTKSPTITDVKDSPLTVYYKVTADGYNDLTGSATVTINKANAAVTRAPLANDLTYNGKEQNLVTPGHASGGTMQFALGMKDAAIERYSTSVPSPTNAGTYYVWYKVVADANHVDTPTTSVKSVIRKATIPELSVSIEGWVLGEETKKPSINGNISGGAVSYSYKVKGADDSTYSSAVPTAPGMYTVRATVAETQNYLKASDTADFEITADGEDTTNGTADFELSAPGSNIQGILEFNGAVARQMAKIAQQDDTPTGTGQKKEVEVKLNAKAVSPDAVPANEVNAIQNEAQAAYGGQAGGNLHADYLDLKVKKIVIVTNVAEGTEAQTIYTDLTNLGSVMDIPVEYDMTGKFNPVIFRVHDGVVQRFTRLDVPPTELKDGTFYVEGGGAETIIHLYTSCFSTYAIVTNTQKPQAVVTKSPEGKSLTATGSAQELINPGEASGGKMQYALGTDATTAPESGWSDAIPAGTEAGTYYVWYKAAGDENHTDSAAACIAVSVAQKEKKQEENEKTNASIKINSKFRLSSKGGSITAEWGKVPGATSYEVRFKYCGTGKWKTIKSTRKTSYTFSKVGKKKLNPKKCANIYIRAYNGSKVVAKTIIGHVAHSQNKTYTNVKKISISKTSYTLRVGRTKKLQPKLVLETPGKKKLDARKHDTKEFRYASSDPSVATVNKNGKIKAVGKGKCDIWIYAINGCGKKVKVTVR